MARQTGKRACFDRWPEEVRQQYLKDATTFSLGRLASKYGICKKTAKKYNSRHGVIKDKKAIYSFSRNRLLWQRWPDSLLQQFKADATTLSVYELSLKYGIAACTAARYIKQLGIERTPEFLARRAQKCSANMKASRARSRRRAIMGMESSYPAILDRKAWDKRHNAKNNLVCRLKYINSHYGSRTLYYDEHTKRSRLMEYRYGRGPFDPSFKDQRRYRFFDFLPITELEKGQQRVAAKHDFYIAGEVV